MVHRNLVYFKYTDEIDVSVLVVSENDDENDILLLAKRKLDEDGLGIITSIERKYWIEHLETIT